MTASTTLERSPTGVERRSSRLQRLGAAAAFGNNGLKVGPLGDGEVEQSDTLRNLPLDISMIDNEWHMTRYPIVPGHELSDRVSNSATVFAVLRSGQRVGLGLAIGFVRRMRVVRLGEEHRLRPGKSGLS